MFDTKIAFIVRDDLPAWQRLNVVAFLATGIAAAAPEIIGERYVDSLGRQYGSISGQPMLIFEADLAKLQGAHRKGLERELTLIPYVHAMFSTGHDEANRQVFLAERPDNLDLVGLAIHGPKKAVDKAIKGMALHR
ncbi:DUF2000 domain-containing protein [Serratia ficaria]|uniref:Uncharacterized protein conserved in bacteria n=1 Tax=Serratia ficaria TaxID=61651 RepID=A0A240C3C2_SERFI|nr:MULTISPECIES: DUF2000 domain-containing protein [Serratia]MEE4482211.1 DUF2000 domain-containing protein [Serratia ficaria]REF44719.1 hypothetical protein C7332_3029 [Serratia ficaria]CAI0699966.1 Uncharacterized protein conserved in bacteria [Serratia ficaria]CAI0808742.1 Uncharacterized protein conserved in bacteria [Serratia ficaria]CAI0815482.1 Uncharacterized protein conserved in bacteria [Serratia ficaria]